MELEDSDDLCPVCENNCTCQKGGEVSSEDSEDCEYFSRQKRKSRASKRSLLSPVTTTTTTTNGVSNSGNHLSPSHSLSVLMLENNALQAAKSSLTSPNVVANCAVGARKRAKYFVGHSSGSSYSHETATTCHEHIEISYHHLSSSSSKDIHGTNHSNSSCERKTFRENAIPKVVATIGEIQQQQEKGNQEVFSDENHHHHFTFSDEDYFFDDDEDEEDSDDDEIYLKYDSVEYEYIVSDLLANDVISELALLEDPIESLDILLFGSNGEEDDLVDEHEDDDNHQADEELSGADSNCISFEIDLIPSQQHVLPQTVASSSSSIANPNPQFPCKSSISSEVPQRSQSAVNSCTLAAHSFSSSQPLFTASAPALTSNSAAPSTYLEFSNSNSYHQSQNYHLHDGYDSAFYWEEEFAYTSCPEDSPSSITAATGGSHSNESSSMLKIEDLLDSRLFSCSNSSNASSSCSSRQILYSNEFLERYKKIPISAFRRSRRRSFSQHRLHPSVYKRFLKHEDRMLCEGISLGEERNFAWISI